MNGENGFENSIKYYAFISYSSKNEVWAKWLQHELETYRLPLYVRKKRPDVPKKLFPVFRDDTDISGSVLSEALRTALDKSKYLIVLCSPESANSKWVGFEIEYFASVHGTDKIIPIIVSGTPYSNDPETECFHDAIKRITPELLGISVAELGKRRAMLKTVSGMLGLSGDELIRRDRKRRIRSGVLLGVLCLALTLAVSYGIYFNTEHSSYYRSYILKNEVPVGVGRLSGKEQASTHSSYRIVTKQGKVRRLESVNSKGVIDTPFATYALSVYPVTELVYDDSGRVSEKISRDKYGSQVVRDTYTYHDNGRVSVESYSADVLFASPMSASLATYDLYTSENEEKSEIILRVNTYDENGFLVCENYYSDTLGTPGCDSNGIYGKLYTYTPEGFVESVVNLNENGEADNCKYGWSERRFEYTDNGVLARDSTYSTSGELCRDKDGYAVSATVYDESTGYPITLSFYDENLNPCCDSDGVSVSEMAFDENGFMTSLKYYNENGNPKRVLGVFEQRMLYNEDGILIRTEYYDADGMPTYGSVDGAFAIELSLDDNRRITEYRYFGTDGKPCRSRSIGTHVIRIEYDDNGFVSACRFFDSELTPVRGSFGFASCEYENFANGSVHRVKFFNSEGAPTNNQSGVHLIAYEYDKYGNRCSTRFYDKKEQPVLNTFNVAGWDCEYNSGRLTRVIYVGIDGQPTICADSYSILEYLYDEDGNIYAEVYYDTDGKTPSSYDGYFAAMYLHDDYGNDIGTRFFNDSIDFTESIESGIAGWDLEYENGRVVSKKYIGTDGGFAPHKSGNYEIRYEYDDMGNKIASSYHDAKGELVAIDESNIAAVRYEYDECARVVRKLYYDANNNPTNSHGVYNFRVEYFYDDYGNDTGFRYYDTEGRPTNSSEGIAGVDSVFEDGREVRRTYIGVDGKPTVPEELGYAIVEYEYDKDGNTIMGGYCDVDGDLIIPKGREYAVIRLEYDGDGNQTSISYFDEKDEPMLVYEGYHKYYIEINEDGTRALEAYYGIDGKPVFPKDIGHSSVKYKYDDEGRIAGYVRYDENGDVIEER